MKTITIDGYTFRYNDEGIYLYNTYNFNLLNPGCIEAMQKAIDWKVSQRGETTRPAYVYVSIGNPYYNHDDEYYKIGSSYEPKTRTGIGEILFTIICKNRREAFDLEFALHRHFADKHVANEWFDLDESDVEYIRNYQGDISQLNASVPLKRSVQKQLTAEQIEELRAARRRANAERPTLDTSNLVGDGVSFFDEDE